jgi:hypothetical protein
MQKICKCPKNKRKIRIIGNCEVCSICGGIIAKVRETFHRKTSVKPVKNKYNRAKTKRELKEELDNE